MTVAIRKTIVSPASRIDRAISLGVFCREAPSTSAIIRSRNVSPGLDVISTTIRSESTRVPPVTADRSPPDSRMTGADSPVIADSSTEAIPSTTVPSPGITWPGFDDDPVALCAGSSAGTGSSPFRVRRRAIVSVRPRRSAAACALPRPSAIASAKFAKSSVNQSQSAIWKLKRTSLPRATSRTSRNGDQDRSDEDDEHDRVLRLEARIELAEGIADGGADDRAVEKGGASRLLATCILLRRESRPSSAAAPRSGPSEKAGKKVNAPTIRITPTSRKLKSGPVTGNVPADSGTFFLAASEPAMPRIGISMKKRPKNMSNPRVVL